MVQTVWIALASLVQPAGLFEAAAVMAVVLLAALCAHLLTTLSGSGRRPVPVRVRADRSTRLRSTNWDADAPGRPQPRAPGCGCSLD